MVGPSYTQIPSICRSSISVAPYSHIQPTNSPIVNTKVDTVLSDQISCSVLSNSLQPHGLQHTRLPCPSPTPGACSNSPPLSRWCHPTISSSVIPFSFCPIFPRIRAFSNETVLRMRWPKYWSFSFSISPSNEHPGLISSRLLALKKKKKIYVLKTLCHWFKLFWHFTYTFFKYGNFYWSTF